VVGEGGFCGGEDLEGLLGEHFFARKCWLLHLDRILTTINFFQVSLLQSILPRTRFPRTILIRYFLNRHTRFHLIRTQIAIKRIPLVSSRYFITFLLHFWFIKTLTFLQANQLFFFLRYHRILHRRSENLLKVIRYFL
jgi:hypothetical protein